MSIVASHFHFRQFLRIILLFLVIIVIIVVVSICTRLLAPFLLLFDLQTSTSLFLLLSFDALSILN